ncbi:hypothetical protein OHA70_19515 [Kribbella sp. NBC_00382]|uniref:hypothetical protein n=1 Tax=Kribbella sp. NBC_00382 TaxID=2975967 RepID=UPI002E1C8680
MVGVRWGVLAVVAAGLLAGCGAETAGEAPPGILYGSPIEPTQIDPGYYGTPGRMTLVEMEALSARVTADIPYWARRGIVIGSVGPMPDGSGISVMTTDGSVSDRENLMKRYATDAIAISAGTVSTAGG